MKITGIFKSLERANETLAKLKNAGFTDAYIELDNNNNTIKKNIVTESTGYSLSNLTIDPNDMQQHPITSISPIINVTGGFTEYNDRNYRLKAEVDLNSVMRAKDLIRSMGGKLETEKPDIGRVHEDIGELNHKFKENGI